MRPRRFRNRGRERRCVGRYRRRWRIVRCDRRRNGRHDGWKQLWGAAEGEPSTLVIDLSPGDPACAEEQVSQPACHTGYDLANTDPEMKYGKVWLLPYNTDKDGTVSYPTAFTWYDDLVISRARIADPAN